MKKKTRAPARGAAKRSNGPVGRKAAPLGLPSGDRDKATIRRLKRELAAALNQIEELQASAETDFLLGVSNRRGFERELDRAMPISSAIGQAAR